MNYEEKINKLDKAIASPVTPKEFITDLKKRKVELEEERVRYEHEQAEKAKVEKEGEDARLKTIEDKAKAKKAKVRTQVNNGKVVKIKKKVKNKFRSLAAINKDKKYFNKEQKHEVEYADKKRRKKIIYKKFFKKGGDLSKKNDEFKIKFQARQKGAIGAKSTYTEIVSAPSEYLAILKLYDKYESISIISINGVSHRYEKGGDVYKEGGKVQPKKVEKVLHEYKKGKLKTSAGKKVTNRKQSVAIALSEAGLSNKK